MIHNKLVRDRIPEIIEKGGKTPVTRTLDADEYRAELRRKLTEARATVEIVAVYGFGYKLKLTEE